MNQTLNDSIIIDDVYEKMNASTTYMNRSIVKHMKMIED